MSTPNKITLLNGHVFDSQREFNSWTGGLRDAGLNVVHNAMLPHKWGTSWRKPDFFFPCTCGLHGIAWEVCGLLDNPYYTQKWLAERLPWYLTHSDWYLLLVTEQAHNFADLQETIKLIRKLLANNCEGLHKTLQSGLAREHIAVVREMMSARRQLAA